MVIRLFRCACLAGLLSVDASRGSAALPRKDFHRIAELRADATRASYPIEDASPSGAGERAAVGGLHLYRFLFSSQDADRCRFRPSCSVFAEDAVLRAGTLRGALMASDRLQRCHLLAGAGYARDLEGRLLDPVSRYLGPEPGAGGGPGADPFTPAVEAPTRAPKPAATAAVLSTLIPGAGKLYAGRPADALVAALATGLPLTFAVQDFRRDGVDSVRGWFMATLAGGFYLGNIWGSAAAAGEDRDPSLSSLGMDRRTARERYFDALVQSSDSLARAVDPEASARVRYEGGLALFAAGDYRRASGRFLDLAQGAPDSALRANARFLQTLALAHQHRWQAAVQALSLVPADAADSASLALALRTLRSTSLASGPDPSRARWFSAVLPGAGQVYSGDPVGGLKALGVNGLMGYYVYDAARTRSYGELLVCAVPLFWRYYRGNVQAAERSAGAAREAADERALSELYLQLDLGPR